jgi:hypothetical protein
MSPVPKRTSIPNQAGFFSFAPPTMAAFEGVAQSPDGWTAVVRLSPYRVDWRNPQGGWVKGQPLRVPTVEMSGREKLFYLERNPAPRGDPPRTPESITDWPSVVPPVGNLRGAVFAAPDGRALIARHPSADFPGNRYDVVNRRGELEGQLSLPATERVIDFGSKSVYIIVTDADGIQRVRRHAWPALRGI